MSAPAPARPRSTSPGHAYLAGPYKGAPLSLGDRHPGGRRSLRPRHRRRPRRALRQPGNRPDHAPSPTRCRRSSRHPARRALDRTQGRPPQLHPQPDQLRRDAVDGQRPLGQRRRQRPLSDRFQVGDCNDLAFKPKLAFSLKGRPSAPATRP